MRDIDDTDETAAYIGITPKSLRQRRYRGDAPPAIKLGTGRTATIRYRKSDVDAWLEHHLEPASGGDYRGRIR